MATDGETALVVEPAAKDRPTGGHSRLEVDDSGPGVTYYVIAAISMIFIVLFFPFSLLYTVKIVSQYERAVILRLGRLSSKKAKGPGLFFVIPCTDTINKVDLRTITLDILPQEILTKDSVTVTVDAVVFYRIYNPTMTIVNVENANTSTYYVAQTTLRNVLGTKRLSELLSEREQISIEMQQILDEATDPWGVKVEKVEIKDVSLPQQLQRAMAAEAEASREARAKVVSAEGEQNAARVLREAANIMDESPATLQLRYLQTLNTIAGQNNHTYVFPLPIDLLAKFFISQKS